MKEDKDSLSDKTILRVQSSTKLEISIIISIVKGKKRIFFRSTASQGGQNVRIVRIFFSKKLDWLYFSILTR